MKFFCVFLLQICYQKFWQSTCLWITVIITGIGTGFIYSSLFTRAALQSQSCFTVATSSRACKLSHQSYTSPSTLSCLSVRFVCNVGVLWPNGWTDQDELGMRVGLGPDHAVLDGDPAPPLPRGTRPQFSFHICCHKMAGWMKMPLGVEVGLSPSDFVLDGDPAPLPKKRGKPPNFRPMSVVAK